MTDNNGAEGLQDAAAAQTTETVETPQTIWAQFGFEDENTFKSEFESLREIKSKADEIEQSRVRVKEELDLLGEAEDPFGGIDEVKQIVAYAKKGIPTKIAMELISASDDTISQNPLNALVLAQAIKNPENYKSLGRETIEQAIKETYGIDGYDDYTPSARMKLDAANAIAEIKNLKQSVGDVKNPYTFAKEVKGQKQEQYTQRQTAAITELERFGETLKELPYEAADQKFSLKVSNEEVKQILGHGMASGLGHFFDVNTKDGKQAAQEWLKTQVLIHKVQNGDFAKQIIDSVKANIERDVIKEKSNGGTVIPNRTGKANEGKGKISAAAQDLAARGLPVPSQTITTT